jgi:hypothetical protein
MTPSGSWGALNPDRASLAWAPVSLAEGPPATRMAQGHRLRVDTGPVAALLENDVSPHRPSPHRAGSARGRALPGIAGATRGSLTPANTAVAQCCLTSPHTQHFRQFATLGPSPNMLGRCTIALFNVTVQSIPCQTAASEDATALSRGLPRHRVAGTWLADDRQRLAQLRLRAPGLRSMHAPDHRRRAHLGTWRGAGRSAPPSAC